MILERLQSECNKNLVLVALKPVAALALGLMLASCAGTPADGSAAADEECTYVKVTGSNLPIRECRSRAEREAIAAREEAAAQNSLRDIQLLDEAGNQSLGSDSLGAP